MNSQTRDRKLIKYPQILLKGKSWIEEELIPLLIISLIIYIPGLTALSIIIYTSLKWKMGILIWLAYFSWTEYDSETPNGAGRKISSLQHWSGFENLKKYFPLRLIKVADLTPDKNYILADFPHGVGSFGVILNLLTNVNKATELFPGIDIRGATMAPTFRFPMIRELVMALGFCSVNKKDLINFLNSKPSKAVIIAPGGAREALLSHPGNIYTIIKNRKGFIRVALETGSWLVPVFSFGEQNTLDQSEIKSPILRALLKLLHKLTRGYLAKIKGRGFFQHKFGILPHRRPVTTVVGEPIEVPKVENPSPELVDEYHEKYFKALFDLFEKYKHEYDEAGDAAQLVMVSV